MVVITNVLKYCKTLTKKKDQGYKRWEERKEMEHSWQREMQVQTPRGKRRQVREEFQNDQCGGKWDLNRDEKRRGG